MKVVKLESHRRFIRRRVPTKIWLVDLIGNMKKEEENASYQHRDEVQIEAAFQA